jgi:hypothetical protein
MASHDTNQPSSKLLWSIGPIALLLALMFISWNHKSIPNKEVLSGQLPASKKVEAPAHHEAAPADTTAHATMPADAPAHEAAPAEAHAPAAH